MHIDRLKVPRRNIFDRLFRSYKRDLFYNLETLLIVRDDCFKILLKACAVRISRNFQAFALSFGLNEAALKAVWLFGYRTSWTPALDFFGLFNIVVDPLFDYNLVNVALNSFQALEKLMSHYIEQRSYITLFEATVPI